MVKAELLDDGICPHNVVTFVNHNLITPLLLTSIQVIRIVDQRIRLVIYIDFGRVVFYSLSCIYIFYTEERSDLV